MTKDKIVIDIETKNSFADVGGQSFLKKLDASFVGIYSYNQDKYLSFFEKDFLELNKFLKNVGLIIGFSINRFDIPVMEKYCDFDLWKINRLDLLEEVEAGFGNRVGLDSLAKTNLGIGKTHHGLEAITLYKEGNFKELESYCLNDVKITKDLYELAKRQKHLLINDRYSGNLVKVKMDWQELTFPQQILI